MHNISSQKDSKNRTLMTQIIMVKYDFICGNHINQCHQRSIVFGFTFVF